MATETTKSSKTDKTFERSYKVLEKLAQELQSNSVTVDELVPRMKEAAEAISICKEILKETDSQLKRISAQFSSEENNE